VSRLIRLEIENVKRIKALEITIDPATAVTIIRGANAQGKSSILDAVAYALGGKRIQPPKLIRNGQREARVLLDLEDLIVERWWWTEENGTIGSEVQIRSKDGQEKKPAQRLLDALIGRLAFDPLAFNGLDPAAQAEALRKVVGLDFAALDGKRTAFYTDRTAANGTLAALEARLNAMPAEPELARVDVSALLDQQRQLEVQVGRRSLLEQKSQAAAAAIAAAVTLRKEAEAAMAKAYARVEAAEQLAKTAAAELAAVEVVDPLRRDSLNSQIAAASDNNERVRKQVERGELAKQVDVAREKVGKLNRSIADIDADKAAQLKAVVFPIPGLGFGDVGVTMNDLPLEQASDAERLRISVAIGFAQNPGLKLLMVRGGEKLDTKGLALLDKLATEADGQVLLEVMSEADTGIVIVDGMVKGAA